MGKIRRLESTLLDKYKNHFPDIDQLYDYQLNVLEKLLNRQSTLAVIPTGGGKSLLYQLIALELNDVTIVVSPLLALMEEQVKELNESRNIKAIAFNSSLSFDDQRKVLRNLSNYDFKLIYLSPERLQNPFFRSSLISSGIKVGLVVIDEAHCISQWGGSFRPEYREIKPFITFLKKNSQSAFILCLTATLSKIARTDISKEFEIDTKNVLVNSTFRENLKLTFHKVEKETEKLEALKAFLLKFNPEKAIVYLYSQEKCVEYADELSEDYSTGYYHAGIEQNEKTNIYEKFIQGDIQLLFATTAFGMGINIPNIASIIHLQIPNSIEEYYQQVGRGWRNKKIEKDCNCLAIWSDTNFEKRRETIEREKYSIEDLKAGYNMLLGQAEIMKKNQLVTKDKGSIMSSTNNLILLKYKFEKYGLIKTIGELNGAPSDIELKTQTGLWTQIKKCADEGVDSFVYVCDELKIPLNEIIDHLYEQDLIGNIKKLPAMKKDIYFEVTQLKVPTKVWKSIRDEVNKEVDFRMSQLQELHTLFSSKDYKLNIGKALD